MARKKVQEEQTVKKSSGAVDFDGASLQVRNDVTDNDKSFIPEINQAYVWHKHTFDIVMDIADDRAILATGHAGTGKSSIFEQIAARIGQPVVRPAMNGQMTTADLLGYQSVKKGELVWVDGTLTDAMRTGKWIIIDEIDFADANILSALNTVTEPHNSATRRRKLILKENGGELVIAHPNFRIFSTANTAGCMEEFRSLYNGARKLNYAFLSRFRIYYFDYLPPQEEVQALKSTTKVKEEFCIRMVEVANLVREAFKNSEVSSPFSMRQLHDWANLIERHLGRALTIGTISNGMSQDEIVKENIRIIKEAAEPAIFSRVSPADREVISGIVDRTIAEEET